MNKTDNERAYVPIDCDRYSEYELAIMHRQKLRLRWHDNNVVYEQTVTPLDLQTKEHEEFLICRGDDGALRTLRLDHIQKMETL
jgi:Rho-binding antiterminator